jgi:hypothetical protein
VKNGKWQAKDIRDDEMLNAVRRAQGLNGVPEWSSLWDIQAVLTCYPAKVVQAKLGSLVRRGVLKGCACGCRGDFEFPTEET